MRKQVPVKEQNKIPQKELNEKEASNLPKKFKTLAIRQFSELGKTDELSKNFNKEKA